MKTLLITASFALALGCGKKTDTCQMMQGGCNGHAYDCGEQECACEFPYEGEFCGTYAPSIHAGQYVGVSREYVEGEGGTTHEGDTIELTISNGADSLYAHSVVWVSVDSFDLFKNGTRAGGGSVIQEQLSAKYNYTKVFGEESEEATVVFKGDKI